MIKWNCCRCGVASRMPKHTNDALRKSHKTFWCINGHSNYYPHETEEEKLGAKVKKLEKEIEQLKFNPLYSFIKKIFKSGE